MPMREPYFAKDTAGVHFQIDLNGTLIWAHVACDVLAKHYRLSTDNRDWVAIYHAHRQQLDACAARLATRQAPEIVIIELADLAAML